MDLLAELKNVIEALQVANIDFAVCGGFAMAMHGLPRFTKDIDLLIQPADADRVVKAVERLDFSFDAGNMEFKTLTVRRGNKIVGRDYFVLDLLLANASHAEVWSDRVVIDWNGLRFPVVSAVGLARMKRAAGRPQDLVDITRLGFSLDDPVIQP